MSFDESLKHLLQHEGGFTSDNRDPGNANGTCTNLGVTQRVWEEWTGHPSSRKEMHRLMPEDVAPLYRKKYWDRVHADNLPVGVDYAVFDAGVNSGTGRASKWLQEACGAVVDGSIGPQTMKAVRDSDPVELINKICDIRQSFLEELKTFSVFGRGWTRRVSEVRANALKMRQE